VRHDTPDDHVLSLVPWSRRINWPLPRLCWSLQRSYPAGLVDHRDQSRADRVVGAAGRGVGAAAGCRFLNLESAGVVGFAVSQAGVAFSRLPRRGAGRVSNPGIRGRRCRWLPSSRSTKRPAASTKPASWSSPPCCVRTPTANGWRNRPADLRIITPPRETAPRTHEDMILRFVIVTALVLESAQRWPFINVTRLLFVREDRGRYRGLLGGSFQHFWVRL